MPCIHIKSFAPVHSPPTKSCLSQNHEAGRGRVISVMSDGLRFVLITGSGMLVIHIKHIIDKAGGAVLVPYGS